MSKTRSHEERLMLERAVERQMRWRDLLGRLSEEVRAEREAAELEPRIGPYIAISRQAGAGGAEIARRLGEKLGWQVADKQIVEFMAERFRVDRNLLDMLDEARTNWIRDTLGVFVDRRVVTEDAYVAYLGRIVMLLGYQGHVVLVGRGAQFFLPREQGLAVRVIAEEKDRVGQLQSQSGRSAEQARELMQETDQARDEFVQRHFHRDIDDPLLYDVIVNSSRFNFDQCAELIAAAYRLRGLE